MVLILSRPKAAKKMSCLAFFTLSLQPSATLTCLIDTLKQMIVTSAYRGPPDGGCLRRFSALGARESEDKSVILPNEPLGTRCQYCFQIGRECPITLCAATSERNCDRINPLEFRIGVRLHLGMIPYRNCLLSDDSSSTAGTEHWEFFKTEIARAAPELQERGILDFSNDPVVGHSP